MGELELAALAETQGGLVTRPQTRAHLTREQVKHRLGTGRLVAVRWGVYRYAGTPGTPMLDLRAACLAAGPAAVISHRSAAALWGFPSVASEEIEVTVPWPQWPRLPGVRTHQSVRLPAGHCTVHDGVPVTSAARTVADLACVFPAPFVGRLADACLRRGLFGLAELHGVYDVLAGRGRHGMAVLVEVLARRPLGYEPGGSAAERDIVSILAEHGVPLPVQQFQVVIDGRVCFLDFAYPDLRIALEYDGYAFHRLPSDLDRVAARHTALTLAGWTVLYFTAATGDGGMVASVTAARQRALRALGGSDPHLRGKVG